MDAQEILLTIGGSIAVVMAIAGLVATIWAVARVKGIEQSVELISKANVELRAANEDLRRELHESSAECADRVTRLEAANAALTDGMGQRLADSIAIHLQPAMMLVAQGVIDNIAHRSSDRAERFGQQGGTP